MRFRQGRYGVWVVGRGGGLGWERARARRVVPLGSGVHESPMVMISGRGMVRYRTGIGLG